MLSSVLSTFFETGSPTESSEPPDPVASTPQACVTTPGSGRFLLEGTALASRVQHSFLLNHLLALVHLHHLECLTVATTGHRVPWARGGLSSESLGLSIMLCGASFLFCAFPP